MAEHYRDRLFKTYATTHAAFVGDDDENKPAWFTQYAERNYRQHFSILDRNASILEIGCGKGYLLSALASWGFSNLIGIDLSPDEIAVARKRVPNVTLLHEGALEHLDRHPGHYDVIITKAVLEHVAKDSTIPFIEKSRRGLKPGGMLVIDVPNMDWLFAMHERYMDFTHEVGFTRESIGQVLRNFFTDVTLHKRAFTTVSPNLNGRVAMALRPMVIRSLGILFKILGEGAGDTWWYSRSIIAVARVNS